MIRISVVSYLNAIPFVEGLQGIPEKSGFELSLDIPSVCAAKVLSGEADLGLVPVAIIPLMKDPHLIGNYCIGADGKVASVILAANEPVENLTSVILDRESRTSVLLAQILARDYWKINPEWKNENTDIKNLPPNTGAVIIGNRALEYRSQFAYCYDLAEAWKNHTGLPFVFACWIANKPLQKDTSKMLNFAFTTGLSNREAIAIKYAKEYPYVNVKEYLCDNINYDLSEDKMRGLSLFLTLIESMR